MECRSRTNEERLEIRQVAIGSMSREAFVILALGFKFAC